MGILDEVKAIQKSIEDENLAKRRIEEEKLAIKEAENERQAIEHFSKNIENSIRFAAKNGTNYIHERFHASYISKYAREWCDANGFKFEYCAYHDYDAPIFEDNSYKDYIRISW